MCYTETTYRRSSETVQYISTQIISRTVRWCLRILSLRVMTSPLTKRRVTRMILRIINWNTKAIESVQSAETNPSQKSQWLFYVCVNIQIKQLHSLTTISHDHWCMSGSRTVGSNALITRSLEKFCWVYRVSYERLYSKLVPGMRHPLLT